MASQAALPLALQGRSFNMELALKIATSIRKKKYAALARCPLSHPQPLA